MRITGKRADLMFCRYTSHNLSDRRTNITAHSSTKKRYIKHIAITLLLILISPVNAEIESHPAMTETKLRTGVFQTVDKKLLSIQLMNLLLKGSGYVAEPYPIPPGARVFFELMYGNLDIALVPIPPSQTQEYIDEGILLHPTPLFTTPYNYYCRASSKIQQITPAQIAQSHIATRHLYQKEYSVFLPYGYKHHSELADTTALIKTLISGNVDIIIAAEFMFEQVTQSLNAEERIVKCGMLEDFYVHLVFGRAIKPEQQRHIFKQVEKNVANIPQSMEKYKKYILVKPMN